MLKLPLAVLGTLGSLPHLLFAQQPAQPLVITAARMIDVERGTTIGTPWWWSPRGESSPGALEPRFRFPPRLAALTWEMPRFFPG